MNLEHNEKTNIQHEKAIIFVHGNWHGAWCWHKEWLDFFYAQGYDVHTFSFRNHGESDSIGSMRWLSVEDYADDLATIHARIAKPVFLVGHSMGGMTVQKYLERQPKGILGGVLLTAVPPHGVWRVVLKTITRHPLVFLKVNLTFSLYPIVEKLGLIREVFVGDDFPEEDLVPYWKKLQDESFRGFVESLFLNLPKPKKVKAPIMVIGGEKDYFFNPTDVNLTAQAYGVSATIYPGAPHNLFMVKGWENVATDISNWMKRV
jgi:pimeloyl-ACP methyl ester carboxylesterase